MSKVLIVVLAALVAGCGNLQTKVVSTSERTVAVQSFKGMQDAQNVADGQCKKHGRAARWIGGVAPEFIFDCML